MHKGKKTLPRFLLKGPYNGVLRHTECFCFYFLAYHRVFILSFTMPKLETLSMQMAKKHHARVFMITQSCEVRGWVLPPSGLAVPKPK